MTDPYFIEPEVIQFFIDRLAAKRPGWDAPPAAAYLINPPAFVETSYKFTPYEMLLKMSAASRRLWTHGRGFETDLNTQIMGVLAQKEITREVPTIRTLWDLKRAANANLLLRVWEAIWNIEAFPRVVLGSHTYAASLMATSIPVSHVPSVHAPWSVFALDIPDGLLTLSTGHKVRRVRVLERKTDGLTEDWSLLVETEHPTEWYGSLIARLNLTAKMAVDSAILAGSRGLPYCCSIPRHRGLTHALHRSSRPRHRLGFRGPFEGSRRVRP